VLQCPVANHKSAAAACALSRRSCSTYLALHARVCVCLHLHMCIHVYMYIRMYIYIVHVYLA